MSEVFRLPEWNDLTNEQRVAICDEAELWSFDEHLERDAAVSMYRRIRELIHVEPPPLMVKFARPAKNSADDGGDGVPVHEVTRVMNP